MNKNNPISELASPGRRLGAFFIDQTVLGFANIIAALVIFGTQSQALNTLGTKFIAFSEANSTVDGSQIEGKLNELMSSPEVVSALGALILPFASWILVSLLLAAIYYIGLTARSGQTLGKKLLRIKVVGSSETNPTILQSAERYFLYVGLSTLSSVLAVMELLVYRTLDIPNTALSTVHSILDFIIFALFFVGALMIVTRSDRRGYHDISADTKVVKTT
ncbi:MAG TPA: RDD family protein [Candidatus Nitrosotenuis sp.]|nr:RDD family protein [Candidatus Nitrosotenuis sp.]